MIRKVAIALVALIPAGILLASFWRGAGAVWVLGVLVVSLPVALIVLAASASRRPGALRWGLVLFGLVSVGAIFALLALNDQVPHPSAAGLPAGLVIMLVGIWLVPLIVTSWAHAASFEPGGESAQRGLDGASEAASGPASGGQDD